MLRSAGSVRFHFFTVFGLIAVVLWGAIAVALQTAERKVMEKTSAEERNLARNLAERVGSSVRAIDLSLKTLCDDWVRDPASFAGAVARQQEFIKNDMFSLVGVIDADGRFVWSNAPRGQGVDVSDREHFKIHKQRGTRELYIGAPVLGRVSKLWTIQFTRPIYDQHQKFAGMLVLLVPPPALDREYDDIQLGAGGTVVLVRSDGQILSHSRDPTVMAGVSLAKVRGLRPEDAPAGEYRAKARGVGVERLFRYQKVRGYPLTVFVGQSMDTVLTAYHAQRAIYLALGALATVLLLAFMLLVISRCINKEQADQYGAQLAAIVQNSNNAIVSVDRDARIVSWNTGAERLYGYTEAEVVGQPFPVTLPADRLSEFAALPRRIFQGEQVQHFETVCITKGGRRIDVLLGVSAIKNTRDSVVGISVIAQDITERKRAEETRVWLAAIVENSIDAIIGRTLDGKILSWNAAAKRLFGYSTSEAIGQSIMLIMQPGDHGVAERHSVVLQGGGKIPPAEVVLQTKDGRLITVLRSISPIKNDAGQIIGIAATMRDISERKRAEAQLRLAASVFDNAAEGIVITGKDNNILSVNRAFTKITGYSPEEAIGSNPRMLSSGRRTPTFNDEMWTTMRETGRWQGEVWDQRKDGQSYCGLLSIAAIRDNQGEIAQHCAIFSDITKLKVTEAELRALNAQLEDRVAQRTTALDHANKELETFSYSVSHDLRAPLLHISGFIAILLKENEGKLDADSLDYLKRINAASERMGLLIADLMALSRISRQDLSKQDFDLSELAGQVVDSMIRAHPKREVLVTVKPEMKARGDPGLVRIVLENLIGNAAKYTGQANEPRIEVGLEERDGKTAYYVRDNGAGFDMKYADRLFAPFQRLHSDREFQGTGIGLSIVQRIVVRHGGRIWPEAEVGKGATFYFTLV